MEKVLFLSLRVLGISTVAEAGKGRQPCSGKKGISSISAGAQGARK